MLTTTPPPATPAVPGGASAIWTSARSATNGWAVTATAAGEWIEFKEINFSAGNYRFPIRYSALAIAHAPPAH